MSPGIVYMDLPLRGTNIQNGHDILVIALVVPVSSVGEVSQSAAPQAIYVDQDGSMGQTEITDVNVNWRYNDNTRQWLDVDTGEELGDDVT